MCIGVFVLFFKDTATTEIYTDGHTLSLHDAFPICRRLARGRGLKSTPERAPAKAKGRGTMATKAAAAATTTEDEDTRGREESQDGPLRSEEHTSALQSLMRTSYAVFCLKKKHHQSYTKRNGTLSCL